ncbi:MAG: hypothetical protein IKT27_04190 [Clostridia bacterium]|nr:hypothetical protein [Clostridia bacterium]
MEKEDFLRGMSKEDVVAYCKYKPKRDAFIEEISLDCKDAEICKLFDLMLDNVGIFAQIEIEDFFKDSVLLLRDSSALAKFVCDNRVSPFNKRYLSERIIELKIPQENFACAKYYDSEKFIENLADYKITDPNTINSWQDKLVKGHCDVIAKSKHSELNKQCISELEHCDKAAHQKISEKEMGM